MELNEFNNSRQSLVSYQLIKNYNNTWTVHEKLVNVAGQTSITIDEHINLEKAIYLLKDKGLEEGEIKIAINEMNKMDHNVAEFGFFGGFIFSYYQGFLQ